MCRCARPSAYDNYHWEETNTDRLALMVDESLVSAPVEPPVHDALSIEEEFNGQMLQTASASLDLCDKYGYISVHTNLLLDR